MAKVIIMVKERNVQFYQLKKPTVYVSIYVLLEFRMILTLKM
jgi:hypothetical protein